MIGNKNKHGKLCIRKVIGMDDRFVMLVGIPLLGFLIPLIFFRSPLTDEPSAYWVKVGVATVYSFSYWVAVRYILIYFRRRYPDFNQLGKRQIDGNEKYANND